MQIVVNSLKSAKGLNFIQIIDALDDVLEESAKRLVREHEEIVEDWNNAPSFDSHVFLGSNATIFVWPTGDLDAVRHWHWVSRGTGNLGVRAKGAGYPITATKRHANGRPVMLPMRSYLPHTSGIGPGFKKGGSGKHSPAGDGPWRFSVEHFGIAPRHFEEGLRSHANLWWGPGIRDAIKKATR